MCSSDLAETQNACGVHSECLPEIRLTHEKPAKGTVVLVHGLTANPMHMRDLASKLQSSGYNVVLPILTGHGGGDVLLENAALREWKKDIEFAGNIAERLGEPLFLMGHSTGGVISALEAAAHPGKYKAFIGLDPALNLDGEQRALFDNLCIGSKIWTFPRELPLLLQKPDEVVNIPDIGQCLLPRSAEPALAQAVEGLRVKMMVRKFCGEEFAVPRFNYEFTLSALCALKNATMEMNSRKMARLPPSLLLLSKDSNVFGYISKEKLLKVSSERPTDKVMESQAPFHGLMVASCSPGFEPSMQEAIEWLNSHR